MLVRIPYYTIEIRKIFAQIPFELNNSLTKIVCESNPLQFENFDSAFDNFVACISQMIDKHAPLKRLSRKQKKLVKKPWITKGILTSIRKKNSIFRTLFIYGSDAEKIYFRTYSNKLTKIKTLSKKLYFQNELKKNKNYARKTWDIIKSTLPVTPY